MFVYLALTGTGYVLIKSYPRQRQEMEEIPFKVQSRCGKGDISNKYKQCCIACNLYSFSKISTSDGV